MVLWNTPNLAHVRRVSWATGPDVARTPYFTRRFVVFALVVIRDQMGTFGVAFGSRSLFDPALRGDPPSARGGVWLI